MQTKTSRFTSWLLTVVMLLSSMAGITPAFAAKQTSTSNLNTATDKYVDESDGSEIADSKTSSVSYDEKKPQTIEGYTYTAYSEETKYAYSGYDFVYIYGYPDGSVQGEGNMTRAEATAVFYRIYGGNFPKYTSKISENTFSDVSSDAWYWQELATCYSLGLIDGYEDGTFRPDEPITRAEFAVLAAKWAELGYLDIPTFSDVQKGYWAYGYISAAVDAGWIVGYGDGTFRPDEYITRAEVVTLVNNMFDRSITADELRSLGVECPYNDLVDTYWGYGDLMEASIPHTHYEWHGTEYNDGKLNVITEHFADANGNEIAESINSEGKELYTSKSIANYEYIGYLTEITYVYSVASAVPAITKTANVETANVGDTITYTITVGNDKDAPAAWEDVVVTDELSEELEFMDGSVYIDGKTASYTYKDGTLTVEVGKIAAGKGYTITFKAKVLDTAYDTTIVNTAVGTGKNGTVEDDSHSATDEGVYINKGNTAPYTEKSASVSEAKVGDKVTYTVKMGNGDTATYKIENAIMSDTIPDGLEFVEGSVKISGKSATNSYDDDTKLLTVELGDIAPKSNVVVSFACMVTSDAYNSTITNTAVLSGDNIPDNAGTDDGINIADGKATAVINKSVDKNTAKVGDTLTYTISVSNKDTSTVNLRNVVVSDTISEYLTFQSGSVLVDGYSYQYKYDAANKLLSLEIGELAPGQTVNITFEGIVNSTAYGKTFTNTAIVTADNDSEKQATDDGVTIDKGVADGGIGTKSVSTSTAKVGDTITYTIQLKNGNLATAEWEDVTVTDVISEYLTFNSGSVEKNGSATTEYSYNADTKTLTLKPTAIGIGETVKFTFTCTVNEGAQGAYINNIAMLHDGDTDANMPDTGLTIDAGETVPSITKTASEKEAEVGDIFTYSITVKNGAKATATWQDIVITDTIPTGLKLVSGSVSINGETAAYITSGQTLIISVGDLLAGEDAVIKFEVRVLESSEGTTVTNTAIAKGSNGEVTGSDDGVSISKKEEEAEDTSKTISATKSVDKTYIDLSSSSDEARKATFTLTVKKQHRRNLEKCDFA